MFIAETDAHAIRKVDWDTGMVSTIAGKRLFYGSADGRGESARFNLPVGMVTTSSGKIIVADRSNASLRQITPDGEVTTFAGFAGGFEDGPASTARFYGPGRMALNDSGELYIIDSNVIRKYHNGNISTIAGLKGGPWNMQVYDVPATESTLYNLQDILINPDHSILVLIANALGLISPDGILHLMADKLFIPPATHTQPHMEDVLVEPDGSYLFLTSRDQPLIRYQTNGNFLVLPVEATPHISRSSSFAKHPNGDLYIADISNNVIRKIDQDGNVSFVAGKFGEFGFADGQGEEARFGIMRDICWDGKNSFLIADGPYGTIRRLTPDGKVSTPRLQTPDGNVFYFLNSNGILCDKDGTVYVSDIYDNAIYRLQPKNAVSSPLLHVSHQEGHFYLEWQDSTGDFKLEESSYPSANTEWNQASGSIETHELPLRRYRIEPSAEGRFFRLKDDQKRE